MNQRNRPKVYTKRRVLSLFTGAGGLDIGLEAAGFSTAICVEADEDARHTIRTNRPYWKLAEPPDIFELDPYDLLRQAKLDPGETALLSAGPPCQPFSKATYWYKGSLLGLKDPRAGTLRAFLNVVDIALPHVVLLENVRGLVFNGGNDQSGLEFLQKGFMSINHRKGTSYRIQTIQLNAADYGVPQLRERIFVIASIDGGMLKMPAPTHGRSNNKEPYRTAWDAIGDLDNERWPRDLEPSGKWAALLKSIPEGKNYLWHTNRGGGKSLFGWRTKYWSFLLKLSKCKPSWTIPANPGPASGPFHWRSRLLSLDEIARLQTFPNGYVIVGNRRSAQRQLGNAVPCAIGELLGLEIRHQLLRDPISRRQLTLIPLKREDCPHAHPHGRVPRAYLQLEGNYPDHPGIGLGPGKDRR